MTTITKERLLTIKQWRETYGPGSNVVLPAEEAEELARIALASLEAEPVAYIFKHPAGKLFWALTDESNKEQPDVIPVYAAPPVPVVPEEKPMPNALSMLERESTQLIGDAQEATVTGYELIAEAWRLMDGQDPKTSDWHSKASKYLNSNIVEKVDDDRIEAVKAVLRRLAGNSPVIPGEALSAIMKVARVRADFDDFDGDRRGIGDCLDEAEQELIVTINKYASQLAAEPIATNDVREQTAVPPVPVIQADVAQAIEKLKRKLVECNRYNYCADAVKGVEYACHAAMLQGSQPVSNHEELPLDYLQGQKDGLEWAAQLAEANHPQTGDWLYDDPLELAKAIRKGPDMPEFDGPTPVTPDGWISCSERMPEETGDIIVVSDGIVMSGISYSRRDGFYIAALEYDDDEPIGGVTHWMPLPEPPQEVNRG